MVISRVGRVSRSVPPKPIVSGCKPDLLTYNLQPAPRIQRVIDFELMLKVFHIIWKTQTIARGDGFESACDRISVNVFGHIRSMDDLCKPQQTCIFQIIFENDRLKGTTTLMMAKFHARRIERDRACFFCNLIDLALRYKQKLGFIVNETSDEPGTGNAVHMDVGTGDPFHSNSFYESSFLTISMFCFSLSRSLACRLLGFQHGIIEGNPVLVERIGHHRSGCRVPSLQNHPG